MNSTTTSLSSPLGAVVATLLGVGLFFVIIGVFGLPASITTLALFVLAAILIFRRPQAEELRQ